MQEKLILEKIQRVRQRLNIQRYFQTFATFLFYGFLVCIPLVIADSVTSFNIPPLVFLWVDTRHCCSCFSLSPPATYKSPTRRHGQLTQTRPSRTAL